MTNESWYSNKDLFEKIQELSDELHETRRVVVKYNGLVEKLHNNELRVEKISEDMRGINEAITRMNHERKGKRDALETLRTWTPWVISVGSIVYALLSR